MKAEMFCHPKVTMGAIKQVPATVHHQKRERAAIILVFENVNIRQVYVCSATSELFFGCPLHFSLGVETFFQFLSHHAPRLGDQRTTARSKCYLVICCCLEWRGR